MDLKTPKKETPRAARESPGREVPAWVKGDEHTGGLDEDEGDEEGDALEEGGGVGVEFVDEVDAAPEVCDFVFEDAAGEGEDSVDYLGELEKVGVDWGGEVDVGCYCFEKRVDFAGGEGEGGIDAAVLVVECEAKDRGED